MSVSVVYDGQSGDGRLWFTSYAKHPARGWWVRRSVVAFELMSAWGFGATTRALRASAEERYAAAVERLDGR